MPYPRDWPARTAQGWSSGRIGLPALTPQERLATTEIESPPEYVRVAWSGPPGRRRRGPALRTEIQDGSNDEWVTVAPRVLGKRKSDAKLVLEPATEAEYNRSQIWASRWAAWATVVTAIGVILFGLNATEIPYLNSWPVAIIATVLLLCGTGLTFKGWADSGA